MNPPHQGRGEGETLRCFDWKPAGVLIFSDRETEGGVKWIQVLESTQLSIRESRLNESSKRQVLSEFSDAFHGGNQERAYGQFLLSTQ